MILKTNKIKLLLYMWRFLSNVIPGIETQFIPLNMYFLSFFFNVIYVKYILHIVIHIDIIKIFLLILIVRHASAKAWIYMCVDLLYMLVPAIEEGYLSV